MVIYTDRADELQFGREASDDGQDHRDDDDGMDDLVQFEFIFRRKISDDAGRHRIDDRAAEGVQNGVEEHLLYEYPSATGSVPDFKTDIIENVRIVFEMPDVRQPERIVCERKIILERVDQRPDEHADKQDGIETQYEQKEKRKDVEFLFHG